MKIYEFFVYHFNSLTVFKYLTLFHNPKKLNNDLKKVLMYQGSFVLELVE